MKSSELIKANIETVKTMASEGAGYGDIAKALQSSKKNSLFNRELKKAGFDISFEWSREKVDVTDVIENSTGEIASILEAHFGHERFGETWTESDDREYVYVYKF